MATASPPVAAALSWCDPCQTFHQPLPPGAWPCQPWLCPMCLQRRCAVDCESRYETPDEGE
jgi:hypothetical protein